MKETVSKEILNQYFEENIKKHVVDNVMLSSKKLHEL